MYNSLSKLQLCRSLELQRSDVALVYTYLIPLSCISQAEAVEALLDGLMSNLTGSVNCKSVLASIGSQTLLELLVKAPIQESISNLCSSILLSLLSEAAFLDHCRANMDLLQSAIQLKHPVKTIENLAVVIQRMSKRFSVLISGLSVEFLAVIESLHKLHISDFCDLNLKSILNKGL